MFLDLNTVYCVSESCLSVVWVNWNQRKAESEKKKKGKNTKRIHKKKIIKIKKRWSKIVEVEAHMKMDWSRAHGSN